MTKNGRRDRLHMVDCTLREGDQTPGVGMDPGEKLEIACMLDEAGVAMADAGMPAVSPGEQDFLRRAVEACGSMVVGASVRCIPDEVQSALDLGVGAVFVILPVSRLHVGERLRTTPAALRKALEACAVRVDAAGATLEVALEDASRAESSDLEEALSHAIDVGAARCYLADTVGCRSPGDFATLVRWAVELAGDRTAIGVHCHNDYGLATGNTVAAIEAGVRWPTATVNGIGERAGNASLGEVVLAAECLLGLETRFDAGALAGLSRRVEEVTGFLVPPTAPLVGRNAFRHESGIHTDGILKDPATYEAVSPDVVGRNRELHLGKHSGGNHLRTLLATRGLDPSETAIDRLRQRIQREATGRDRESFRELRARVEAWSDEAMGVDLDRFWVIVEEEGVGD